MKAYLEFMRHIRDHGRLKTDRTGTGTTSVFGYQMRFDLSKGLPVVTTKKIHMKSIIHELIWFLAGDTNVKYLQDNGVTIWDDWAVKEEDLRLTLKQRSDLFEAQSGPLTYPDETTVKFGNLPGAGSIVKESLIKLLDERNVPTHRPGVVGELGPVYGGQWRKWRGKALAVRDDGTEFETRADGVNWQKIIDSSAVEYETIDQISDVMALLNDNPDSRRIIVSAWNVGDIPQMKLPPCHSLFQFYVDDLTFGERVKIAHERGHTVEQGDVSHHTSAGEYLDYIGVPSKRLSCQLYQRSADTFLGVPFNITSYAILTHMFAQQAGMAVGDFIWTGGDCHLYSNHADQVELQLSREPRDLPQLVIKRHPASIFDYKFEDFELVGYDPHPTIKAPVAV